MMITSCLSIYDLYVGYGLIAAAVIGTVIIFITGAWE